MKTRAGASASANQTGGVVLAYEASPKAAIPARLPAMFVVYAATRSGRASKHRPSTWPSPTNVSAISAKKMPATASIGTPPPNGPMPGVSAPK